MPTKEITIFVSRTSNWSAAELMYLYAKNTPGVFFERDRYMRCTLTIEGKKYQCQKWNIHPDEDNEDCEKVTIYLEEVTQ